MAAAEPAEVVIARIKARYDHAKNGVWLLAVPLAWVPIRGAAPIADALAGKDTNVGLTLSISIVFSLALGGGAAALWRRTRRAERDLRNCHDRSGRLERELKALKGGDA